MKRQFSACQTPRSMYPSIFNTFQVIRTASAKNRRFHVPQPTFLFPLETPLRLSVWTVVQTVLTATFNSYGDRQISTPHKINNPKTLKKSRIKSVDWQKIGTIDYICEGILPNLVEIHSLGASGQMGEI